jgi:hypothetical protein
LKASSRFVHQLTKEINQDILWQAVVWVIWKTRNGAIFAQKSHDVHEAVEKIKRVYWQWILAKKKRSPCLYYEWSVNSLYCLVS